MSLLGTIGGAGGGGRIAVYIRFGGTYNFTGTLCSYSGVYVLRENYIPLAPSGSIAAFHSWLANIPAVAGAGSGSIFFSHLNSTLILADNNPIILNVSYSNELSKINVVQSIELSRGYTDITSDIKYLDSLIVGNYVNSRISAGVFLNVTAIICSGQCSLLIEVEGTLTLPDSFIVSGIQLIVLGSLFGVRNLLMYDNSSISLAPTAVIAANDSTKITSAVELESLNVSQGSVFRILGGTKYQNLSFQITSTNIYVDDGGEITASAEGYEGADIPYYNTAASATVAGMTGIAQGNGGGHAGAGGGENVGINQGRGCAFAASSYGEGGGSNSVYNGGAGGGVLHFLVHDLLYIDGIISADGENCPGGAAGGGAGGSIWIRASAVYGAGINYHDGQCNQVI